MLVFKNGTWHDVELPEWTDTSWGVEHRSQFAHNILSGMSLIDAEADIISGIFWKKHGSPENKKEKNSMKKKSS